MAAGQEGVHLQVHPYMRNLLIFTLLLDSEMARGAPGGAPLGGFGGERLQGKGGGFQAFGLNGDCIRGSG